MEASEVRGGADIIKDRLAREGERNWSRERRDQIRPDDGSGTRYDDHM